jgi:hypothetical protein
VVFQINGSSIGGSYYRAFYGNGKDPNLLVNQPQPIRSDEWLVTTQLTIAQKEAGFPRFNPNIDAGRDMSVVGDAPYKDWSVVFKPQNLSFLVLPFGMAFAFKWWLLLYLTIVSCYFVVLRFFPAKRLFASLMGVAVACSPFLFWWYSTGTMGPMFYGFFLILLGMRIINAEPLPLLGKRFARYSQAAYATILGYLLACFAIILYPPFQIPIGLAVAFLLAGYYVDQFGFRKILSRESLRRLAVFVAGAVLASLVVLAFVKTRSGVIDAIRHSAYPGVRRLELKGYPAHEIFSTYLMPQLQRISRAAHYYTNQSEASQFILLLPYTLIPGFAALFARYRQDRRISWQLLMVQLCAILFFCDMLIPGRFLLPLFKVTLLTQVQHGRLFIGLGFLGVLQLLLLARALSELKLDRRKLNIIAALYSFACLAVVAWVGQYTRHHWPQFIFSKPLIAGLGIFFTLIIFCFLTLRLRIATTLLLLFTLISVYRVHPLYHGLGPYYEGTLVKTIDRVSKPGDSWVNLDNLIFENAPLVAGRDSVSGLKPYPDIKYWRQVAGTGSHNHNDYIYNRYAHVYFNTNDTARPEDLHLIGPDSFSVRFGCTPFIKSHVDYALSIHIISYPCTQKVAEVHYPLVTFYMYKID